jgi:hypothetical protein
MNKVQEIVNRILDHQFSDFYDQKDHKVKEIDGFKETLTKELTQFEAVVFVDGYEKGSGSLVTPELTRKLIKSLKSKDK